MNSYIVIGAGILGASTAYHLARSGADVTVIDREDTGRATDAAAGIICPWLTQRRNKPWFRLVKGGAAYYPELVNMLKEDGQTETGYSNVGAMLLHSKEDVVDKMVARAAERKPSAPEMGEVTRLSPEDVKARFPVIAEKYSGVFVSGGARVDGRLMRKALINGAKKYGARFITGDAAIIYEGNRAIGAKVKEQVYEGDAVIVTAGAWAREVLESAGVPFQATFQKAQIVHLELPDADTEDWPVIMPPGRLYLLTFGGGRVVVGATHEDETGFDPRVTAGGVQEVLSGGLGVAPGLADATLVETRVGFRPFTPNFLPVVGSIPGKEGLYAANGLGSSGLTSGPFLGAELARKVRGESTELDFGDYDPAAAIEE
ncbi:NAD(P)/FAD-dependent oxidoreductase [Alteribacter natronophilus]|uniref:NAD(P)/FAD-dependent oxidoreductase n=1 Tax=Alteribacter natronophilus TaxID=2583810 RepID=UPI00110E9DB4|nr:FAD-dependent oxidoreductase [Alteribacter natronophilus]TMW70459.1 FAD-binding oxidoreductase [Alteribacter natronophilus]